MLDKVALYAADPAAFAGEVKTLARRDGHKRLRIGDWRVIFVETATEVRVTKVGHRLTFMIELDLMSRKPF